MMIRKFTLLLLAFGYTVTPLTAQFILQGKIEFERTVNVHKQLAVDDDDGWYANFKSQIPEFKHSYFNLLFTPELSLYEPGRESKEKATPLTESPASANIIYNDLTNNTSISAKQVFDESFLIKDSLRKYQWHITKDSRKIAGFDCKRAFTIIMDSIYVAAFYTDEIVPSSGPESFQGLPGMILGVSIPRLFTTWYATKVELQPMKANSFTPPKKGKNTSYAGMEEYVLKSLKRWGKWGTRYIWEITL